MITARLIGLFASLVFFLPSFAQSLFEPITRDAARETALLQDMTTRYKKDVGSISGTHKKYIAEIYKERYEMVKEIVPAEVISDPKSMAYLNRLSGEIFRGNPFLSAGDMRILFSKSWVPNACSMGEGTILFNIGLFHRLQDEAQAVFVLCHEIAHYYLNHGNNNIQQYVNTVYSDEFQKQLKSISKTEFRKNQSLENLSLNLTFRSRRHSRAFEEAADSMAVELMRNTGYDLNGALTCLALLDSVDKDKYERSLELDKQFNFAGYPFKKSWIEAETISFAGAEDEKESKLEDSLKTHPDCSLRIRKLSETITKLNKPGAQFIVSSKDVFKQQQYQFDLAILDALFEAKNVSRALYFSLQMRHFMPDNVYVKTMIGKCLNEIFKQQKAHQLGNYVDMPGPHFDKDYNNLLNLIQNARLTEIASLSYHFMKQFEAQHGTDSHFAAVYRSSKEIYAK
jgi:hypothetical protein